MGPEADDPLTNEIGLEGWGGGLSEGVHGRGLGLAEK